MRPVDLWYALQSAAAVLSDRGNARGNAESDRRARDQFDEREAAARAHAQSLFELGQSPEPRSPDCENYLRAHLWVLVIDRRGSFPSELPLMVVCSVCKKRGKLSLNEKVGSLEQALFCARSETEQLRAKVTELAAVPPVADVVTAARVDELTRSLAHLRERVNALANGDAPSKRTIFCGAARCFNFRTLAPDEPLPLEWVCGVHPSEPAEP